jgi:hypothetical protein
MQSCANSGSLLWHGRATHSPDAVMLACHGAEAEGMARKHAKRCLRRKEPDWAALWHEVAVRIARGDHGAEAAD